MLFVLKKCKIFTIIILYTALYAAIYLISRFKINELNLNVKSADVTVNVLFWTKYYDKDHFARDHVKGLFQNCPALADRCRLTNDRSLITESAAVIFHIRDFNVDDLPKFRSSKQRWVFFLMESPPHTHREEILKNLPPKYFFNWTMTYRRDSDIVMPYGPYAAEQYMKRLLKINKSEGELNAIISNKTKGVAWIVSNCHSSSDREEYVIELKKYIPVDVYGKCGTLNCIDCYEMVERDYKYYLAFENSLCRDYVTEKFYKPLLYTTVPVVYGGADYEVAGAPPNSYIDVRKFSSAKQLADYLHFLDDNPIAYRRYFDWRIQSSESAPGRQKSMCTLCEKLLSSPVNSPGEFYKDIHSWWYKEAHCQNKISPK